MFALIAYKGSQLPTVLIYFHQTIFIEKLYYVLNLITKCKKCCAELAFEKAFATCTNSLWLLSPLLPPVFLSVALLCYFHLRYLDYASSLQIIHRNEASQHPTSRAKFSPSFCPSLIHLSTCPNTLPVALTDLRFPPLDTRRLLR